MSDDSRAMKVLHVPSGLAGERVDAAISRMFGLSRTKAAELVAAGEVTLDGVAPAKSDRVHEGAFLEVVIPPPSAGPRVVAETIDGPAHRVRRRRLRRGRQTCRRRSPPQRGLDRTDRARTSGRSRDQDRDVRRTRAARRRATPRRRHEWPDGGREVRACLLRSSSAPSRAGPSTRPITRSCKVTSTRLRGTDRRADRATHQARLQVHGRPRRPAQRHALRHARGASVRVAARDQARDRAYSPDPSAHECAAPSLRRRPDLWRGPDLGAPGRPRTAVAACGPARLRAPGDRGVGRSFAPTYPDDLRHALDVIRDAD